tara:strand:+ start:173 stop:505 length:333 start_codon:yes stop_codon:yes gene_type:complete
MEIMAHLKRVITSVKIESQYLGIFYEDIWYQEDIAAIQQSLLSMVKEAKVVEKIFGADRENIRFIWKNQYHFVLNFDCYSQSCWLEAEDDLSFKHLLSLAEQIKETLGIG